MTALHPTPHSTGPIVCLGEVLWDIFPGNKRLLGGAPANVSFQCAALGHPTTLVSAVGNDGDGRAILQQFQRSGLETEWICVDPHHPTGTVVVELDSQGQASYQIVQDVAWDHLAWSHSLERLAGAAQAVCFGTLAQRHPVSRETVQRFLASSRNTPIRLLDLNLRGDDIPESLITESFALANMAKLNRDEFEIVGAMAAAGSERTLDRRAQIVRQAFDLELLWITLGGDGSLLATPAETLREPAVQCPVVDTVGAGDAFCAGLLSGLVRDDPLPDTTRLASRLAARACSNQGAIPSLF